VSWAGVALAVVIVAAFIAWDGVFYARVNERQRRSQEHMERQLGLQAGRIQSLADFLGVDVHDARDDSPAAEEARTYKSAEEIHRFADPDAPTEESPAVPATEPSGIPLAVQSALLRPSPVPRGKSAEWVEEAIKGFNFSEGGRR
jgi:hypothetical protein